MNQANHLTMSTISEAPSFEKLSMASFGMGSATMIDLDDDMDADLDPSFMELLPDELQPSFMISGDILRPSSDFLKTSVCYDSPRINFRSPSPIVSECKGFPGDTTHGAAKKPPPGQGTKATAKQSKQSKGLIKKECQRMTYKDALKRRRRQPWSKKVRTLTQRTAQPLRARDSLYFFVLIFPNRRTTSS
jgi:hypothetical protein